MADDEDTRRAPGRPRDEAIGPTVLAAARRLVGELGYEAVTTRMIADAARSGKPALYRRWPSKAELVQDAFLTHAEAEIDQPPQPAIPVRDQIAGFLRRTFAALVETGPAVRGLMATAQHDAAFRASFRSRFIEARRKALRRLLRAAIADGLLPGDADVEAAVIALYGAVWYRLLLDEPMDGDFPERMAALIVSGLCGSEMGTRTAEPA